MKKSVFLHPIFAVIIWFLVLYANGNNVTVSTPSLTGQNTTDHYTFVQFGLSWDNSWRDDINWDAAWIFVKYKLAGSSEWLHASLNSTAGNHQIPDGYTCSTGLSGSGAGAGIFIYRNINGNGTVNLANVQLRWEYGDNGLSNDAAVTIRVFATEMVYVPAGSFNLNSVSSSNLTNEITNAGITQITNENALADDAIKWQMDSNWGGQGWSDNLLADYPKGYKEFYCMKYELSQGQYTDFLNTLTSAQAEWRSTSNKYGWHRHTISGTHPNITADRPDRACNYLSFMDGIAYLDWAGLRPMTELEFVKAARGSQSVVTDEFSWATSSVTQATTISGIENGTETVNGNCNYGGGSFSGGDEGAGPLRCGIFATASSTREQAGASYYGIMELSGNVYERVVTIAELDYDGQITNAGDFDGSHGDGTLTSDRGYATGNDTWPGYVNGEGSDAYASGFRGGSHNSSIAFVRLADRNNAAHPDAHRYDGHGIRGVRTATETFTPSGSPNSVKYYGGLYDGYDMATSEQDISLPVSLGSFYAAGGVGQVNLYWTTESEINNIGFIVKRSAQKFSGFIELDSYKTNSALAGAGSSNQKNNYFYTDSMIVAGQLYWYKLISVDYSGMQIEYNPISARTMDIEKMPQYLACCQNYPNPFNLSTTISFKIPDDGNQPVQTTVSIFNLPGQKIKVLYDGLLPNGQHILKWNAPQNLPSGIYLYKIQVNNQSTVKKMILLK